MMSKMERVFEVGSDEWKAVTLESADGVAVVGAIALATRDAKTKGFFEVRTKSGESYSVYPWNIDLHPGLVVLARVVREDRYSGEFRPAMVAIPFSAVDCISYEPRDCTRDDSRGAVP